MKKKRKDKEPTIPRIFLTPAYLVEVEKGLLGLYRHMEQEVVDEKTGLAQREKVGKPLGPIGLFRECSADEQPDLRSSHPKTNQPMNLKRVS